MADDTQVPIEELLKQVRDEIAKGFAANNGIWNARFSELSSTTEQYVTMLQMVAAVFDKHFAEWKPEIESSVASAKLEIAKVNKFFNREARDRRTSASGVLGLEQMAGQQPAGAGAGGPFGNRTDSRSRELEVGKMSIHT